MQKHNARKAVEVAVSAVPSLSFFVC